MRKLKLIVGLVFVLIILFGVLFSYITNSSKAPKNPTWNSISIGESDKPEVHSQLGQPIESDGDTENFNSNSPTTPHQVVFDENNKARFVREIITLEGEETYQSIVEKYGEPSVRLYGPGSSFEIFLHVNLQAGVAILGNKEQNIAMEVWYFEPTNLNTFINTWGTEYSLENEEISP